MSSPKFGFLAQGGVEIDIPSVGEAKESCFITAMGPKEGPQIEVAVMVDRPVIHRVIGQRKRGTLLLYRVSDGNGGWKITGDFTPGPGTKVTHVLDIAPLGDIEERSGYVFPLPGSEYAVVLYPLK